MLKENGLKIFLIVFFLGLTGWYLYPSAQNLWINYQMSNMDEEERLEYERENYAELQEIEARSLSLGLDLLGGMHVTLEVRVSELVNLLAENQDDIFEEVLLAADQRATDENAPFITTFLEEFEERNPDVRLARYFRDEEAEITRRSSNSEVVSYLEDQAEAAVERAMEVVRERVDRYGVTEPSIQRQGARRIIVELPGVDEPERVRDLLEGTARLEFRLMADPTRLATAAQDIEEFYAEVDMGEFEELPEPAEDPESGEQEEMPDDMVDPVGDTQDDPVTGETQDQPQEDPAEEPDEEPALQDEGTELTEPGEQLESPGEPQAENPLQRVAELMPFGEHTVFAQVAAPDTARFNQLMNHPDVRGMLPPGVELVYEANPVATGPDGVEIYHVLGVQRDFELSGERISSASVEFDQHTNEPKVSMTMDSEGARTWARVTGANVGEQVAIVLDGVVYSAPRVNERIAGGRSEISGLDSREEAQDIVTVLESGALPAPLDIIGEQTVGPSLGEESIRAGFMSVVLGMLLVVLFMIMYYHTAGVVADIALLLNIVFILGILAGFNAVLTLPGIAGIVLTIGMAVDANVLIFDRIQEEQIAGKTLKAAINTGYEKALSAIMDANITTFFVGAILYSFGVGPIQGFAVTLMAGILSSLFTAIIVTRVIFDYMVVERKMRVSYG